MPQPAGTDRICINCGKSVYKDRQRLCNHCGEPFFVDQDPLGLEAATNGWTTAVIARTYAAGEAGRARYVAEAQVLGEHGYLPQTQSEDGGHIHAGRLLLTGGLSIFAGKAGIRSDGRLSVTFVRSESVRASLTPPEPDVFDQVRKLGELRDLGLISDDEFAAKKADLLARL